MILQNEITHKNFRRVLFIHYRTFWIFYLSPLIGVVILLLAISMQLNNGGSWSLLAIFIGIMGILNPFYIILRDVIRFRRKFPNGFTITVEFLETGQCKVTTNSQHSEYPITTFIKYIDTSTWVLLYITKSNFYYFDKQRILEKGNYEELLQILDKYSVEQKKLTPWGQKTISLII